MVAEFSRQTRSLLDRADNLCKQRGATLTDLRRHVLGLVLDAAAPPGAYELLDQLRLTRRGAAPPTIYRALDFLLAHGLIHKVERLSAFVGCVTGCTAKPEDDARTHAAQFFICRLCRRVIEMQNDDVSRALTRAAVVAGFSISNATIEAEGRCSTCARASHRSNRNPS